MQVVFILLGGLATGIVGAMFGIGGSVLLIPLLNELYGPRQHLHQSAAMVVNFFVALPAAWRYAGGGLVMNGVVGGALPGAVAGVFAGVLVSELPIFSGQRQHNLTVLFGLFIAGVAVNTLTRRHRQRNEDGTSTDPSWRGGLAVGLPTGFVSGLLGVGGGIIAVPLQQLILRLPLKTSIANSAMLIAGLSLVGAAWKNYRWAQLDPQLATEPLMLAAMLIPTVMIGSLIGSRTTLTMSTERLRIAFGCFLLVAAARQLSRGLGL